MENKALYGRITHAVTAQGWSRTRIKDIEEDLFVATVSTVHDEERRAVITIDADRNLMTRERGLAKEIAKAIVDHLVDHDYACTIPPPTEPVLLTATTPIGRTNETVRTEWSEDRLVVELWSTASHPDISVTARLDAGDTPAAKALGEWLQGCSDELRERSRREL